MAARSSLRIEDTDAERSSWEMVAGIVDGLRWLGLDWDEGPDVGGPHAPYFQSQRTELYREHAQALVREGKAYHGRGAPSASRFPDERRFARSRARRRSSSTTRTSRTSCILRSDGQPTYHLSVVVDDIDMAITHVVRGDDHISNTPKQVLLYQAFGSRAPQFAHVPLILGPTRSG